MAVGVVVNTVTTPAPGGSDLTASSTLFMAGITERGSTTQPVLVRSMGEAGLLLGPRVTYGAIYDQLDAFFGEGGSRAYVSRVVGAAAAVGTRTLSDRAASPLATLRVDAKDPGVWSSAITVEVQDGVLPNTFTLIVRNTSNGDVETYANLATPAAAVTATAASAYVRLTNLGSATAAPTNNPIVAAAATLSAGSDDRAAVVAADYVTALARFNPELGAGIVAIPGQAYSAVGAGLAAHAKAHGRLAALALGSGAAVSAAVTAANSLRATSGAEHIGLFYPWVQTPDGSGGLRTISPEGYVAGVRARAINAGGIGTAPAGDIAAARYIVGLEKVLTKAEIDTLADSAVNSIRQTGTNVRLYGWRSLSTDEQNYRFLTTRDIMNHLSVRGGDALEPFAFRTIDGRGHLFAEMETALAAECEPLRESGALYEGANDPGYAIDTGPSLNTPTELSAGRVRVVLYIRDSPVGELVKFTITKVALAAAL